MGSSSSRIRAAVTPPRNRWPSLLVGALMIAIGVALLSPTLIARTHMSMVTGRLMEVLPYASNGSIAVQHIFEFSPEGKIGERRQVVYLGVGRSDAFGREREDRIYTPEEWPQALQGYQRDIERGTPFQIFFHPDHPGSTAMLYDSRLGMWRYSLALVLLLTPLLVWILHGIGNGLSYTVARRRKTERPGHSMR
ncbi:MAG: hypothetical protein EA401_00205 [Planctomycetota bacterium]|nr:MAG: hypothetical protein EA401_00205 [Planctomycetota bacterium]